MRLKNRLITFGIVLLALMALAPMTTSASAVQCQKVLQSLNQSLPSPHDLELPVDALARIEASKLVAFGRAHRGGENWMFSLDPYHQNINFGESVIGEEIQARFIAKILKVAFPKAEITGVRPQDLMKNAGANWAQIANKKVIELRLVDSAERKAFADEMNTNPTLVDMPLIKPANGTLRSLSRIKLRQQYPAKSSHKMATLYFSSFYFDSEFASAKNPDLEALALHLTKNMDLKTLILSPNPRAFVTSHEVLVQTLKNNFPRLMEKFPQVVFLSELGSLQEIEGADKSLVINDTKGRMPYLYALSDFVVVQGPINPIESVMVGTPTFVFANDEVLSSYGLERYKRMIESAQNSGKLLAIENLGQINSEHFQELNQAQQNSPDLLTSDGSSPLDLLLQNLKQKISAQIQ